MRHVRVGWADYWLDNNLLSRGAEDQGVLETYTVRKDTPK